MISIMICLYNVKTPVLHNAVGTLAYMWNRFTENKKFKVIQTVNKLLHKSLLIIITTAI